MHDTHKSPVTVSIEMMSRTAFFSVDDAIDPDRLLLPDGVETVLLDDGDGKRAPEDLWSTALPSELICHPQITHGDYSSAQSSASTASVLKMASPA